MKRYKILSVDKDGSSSTIEDEKGIWSLSSDLERETSSLNLQLTFSISEATRFRRQANSFLDRITLLEKDVLIAREERDEARNAQAKSNRTANILSEARAAEFREYKRRVTELEGAIDAQSSLLYSTREKEIEALTRGNEVLFKNLQAERDSRQALKENLRKAERQISDLMKADCSVRP